MRRPSRIPAWTPTPDPAWRPAEEGTLSGFDIISVGLGQISIAEFSRAVWPFILALVVALFLVTYQPWLALWLPNLVLPAK